MLTDFYAHRAHEKPDEQEFEDDDFDLEAALSEAENEDGDWDDMSEPAKD
jgi:hypothetical protein